MYLLRILVVVHELLSGSPIGSQENLRTRGHAEFGEDSLLSEGRRWPAPGCVFDTVGGPFGVFRIKDGAVAPSTRRSRRVAATSLCLRICF